MVCIVHGIAKRWTQLSDFHFHIDLTYSLSLSLFFFSLFSLLFNCQKFLLSYPQAQRCFFLSLVQLLIDSSKAFAISVMVFLISSI